MNRITVEEIQRDLMAFLNQVEAGESFTILNAEGAIAEIRPLTQAKQPRPVGLCAGEFTVPDDFNEPLPEEILRAFEGQ
jgi:antitoxin (DNA-binding transcriptional repressor) of toxin-antitoxin stability system